MVTWKWSNMALHPLTHLMYIHAFRTGTQSWRFIFRPGIIIRVSYLESCRHIFFLFLRNRAYELGVSFSSSLTYKKSQNMMVPWKWSNMALHPLTHLMHIHAFKTGTQSWEFIFILGTLFRVTDLNSCCHLLRDQLWNNFAGYWSE